MKKMLFVLSLLLLFAVPLNIFSETLKKGDWLISIKNLGMNFLETNLEREINNKKVKLADIKDNSINMEFHYFMSDQISLGSEILYNEKGTENLKEKMTLFMLKEGFHFPLQNQIDLFLSVGAGHANYNLELGSSANGILYNGGIGILYFLHENFAIEAKYDYLSGTLSNNDRDVNYKKSGTTLGLTLKF